MKTILGKIADHARTRVEADKKVISLEEMRERALSMPVSEDRPFEKALRKEGLSFLCEVKKASPSKGLIDPVFDYLQIARDYEAAGAEGLSCLTEPKWFLGSDEIFCHIRSEVSLPMLRKEFVVDEYQIYQAKVMGANAVLLICAMIPAADVARFRELIEDLGMTALVEAHTPEEISTAVDAKASVIGVNNRNLKDFSVDFSNAARLRDMIPPETVYVSESGVTGPEDLRSLRKIGADAVLMGEVLMRASDRVATLAAMREAAS